MTYAADERVDAYIDALPAWQQAICRQVRDLVHAADPEVSETIKRSRQPYYPPGRGHQCACPQRYVQAHHCQQPRRRLAQTEARTLTRMR